MMAPLSVRRAVSCTLWVLTLKNVWSWSPADRNSVVSEFGGPTSGGEVQASKIVCQRMEGRKEGRNFFIRYKYKT